jgi:hypothetical protein
MAGAFLQEDVIRPSKDPKVGETPEALRGCLKSPDSRQILSSMCSFQLPESWHEACTTFCELGIGRTFQTSSETRRKIDPQFQRRLLAASGFAELSLFRRPWKRRAPKLANDVCDALRLHSAPLLLPVWRFRLSY